MRLIGLLCLFLPAVAIAAEAPRCSDDPAFHQLDFWLGDWSVRVGEKEVGNNRIHTILDGCAIRESWKSSEGQHGESLFYYIPAAAQWRQVWVTQRALAPGGTKEKRLAETLEDGSLRFLGEVTRPDSRATYLDRTTLTPNADGTVRQLIEVSTDGTTWQTVFDARYVRQPPTPTP